MRRKGASSEPANHACGKKEAASVEWNTSSLRETLDHAYAGLVLGLEHPLKSTELVVQVGLTHARLGMMRIAQSDRTALRKSDVDEYVHAWVQQVWAVSLKSQVVRWDRSANEDTVLVSCIDRSVFQVLDDFSKRHSLKFSSCIPAVLHLLQETEVATTSDALAVQDSGKHASTIAWTEHHSTQARSSLVQLVHVEDKHPVAMWRGWIPPETKDNAFDAPLQGAIHRFLSAISRPIDGPVIHSRWLSHLPLKDQRGKQT
jgi:hypothetical protein